VYIEYLNEFSASENILKIEKDLNISHIHWVRMSRKIRLKVSKKLKNIDFICRYVLYDNPISQEKALENVLTELLKSNDRIFKIIIDGENVNKYEKYLKNMLKIKRIKVYKLKIINDKKEPLVRLSDFMAGLIRSYYDVKNTDNVYMYELLKRKIKIPD
jgi:disulfide oxidoreductase YuzD